MGTGVTYRVAYENSAFAWWDAFRAAVPALRATIARWGREDGKPAVGESSTAARVLRSAYESPRHALARSR